MRRVLAPLSFTNDETERIKKENIVRTISIDRLDAANSQRDLLVLVREYLSEWRPEELAPFPVACRPGKLLSADDLSHFALELTRAYVSINLSTQQQRSIEQMDAFVGQACRRMAELERHEQLATRD